MAPEIYAIYKQSVTKNNTAKINYLAQKKEVFDIPPECDGVPFRMCPLCKLADPDVPDRNHIDRILRHSSLDTSVGLCAYLVFTAGNRSGSYGNVSYIIRGDQFYCPMLFPNSNAYTMNGM